MNSNNLIWEEKGIIIGIIHALTKNIGKIDAVCIEDISFYNTTRNLFPNLKIYNKFIDNDNHIINISIKSNIIKHNYLVINNLNNLKKIKTNSNNFFILPWFNHFNPIIMFKYKKNKKSIPIDQIRNYISQFHQKRIRTLMYGKLNLIPYKCDYVFWDIMVEYNILIKYSTIFKTDINIIATYLYNNFNSYNCNQNTYQINYISPVQNPIISPVQNPIISPVQNPIISPVQNPIISPVQNSITTDDCQTSREFLRLINLKIRLMNDLLMDVFKNRALS